MNKVFDSVKRLLRRSDAFELRLRSEEAGLVKMNELQQLTPEQKEQLRQKYSEFLNIEKRERRERLVDAIERTLIVLCLCLFFLNQWASHSPDEQENSTGQSAVQSSATGIEQEGSSGLESSMPEALNLTERDVEVLSVLSVKVRLFSQNQLGDHWWNGQISNARKRLHRLVNAGLLEKLTVETRPLPLLKQPVAVWRPGEPTPNAGRIAYQLKSRWKHSAVRPTQVYIATRKTARFFGGVQRGTLKNAIQATHDLGTAKTWQWFARNDKEVANAWVSEDLLAHTRHGEKLPDSFILGPNGQPVMTIEFGGSYDAKRVAAFHADAESHELPYQIW